MSALIQQETTNKHYTKSNDNLAKFILLELHELMFSYINTEQQQGILKLLDINTMTIEVYTKLKAANERIKKQLRI